MGISNYCGRFATLSGRISFNGAQPEKSTGQIELDVASVDTPSDKLDDKLRNEFFEVSKFPTAKFLLRSVSMASSTTADLSGDLTLHGTTRPIVLKTTFNGGRQHPIANAYVLGFSAAAVARISDFGFPEPAWKSFIGNDVTLTIEAEFIAEN
jgi:polyisoprenoid-binding protein YceI